MFHDVNSIFVKILLNRSPCFSGISRAGLSDREKPAARGLYPQKRQAFYMRQSLLSDQTSLTGLSFTPGPIVDVSVTLFKN